MKTCQTLITTVLLSYFTVSHSATPQSQQLFNGENLNGWYTIVDGKGVTDEQDIFTAHQGIIKAYAAHTTNTLQPNAALITNQAFSHYKLSLEYKWGEKKFKPRHHSVRNAGVGFHIHGSDELWPAGVEYQVQQGDVGDIWTIGTRVTSTIDPMNRHYSSIGKIITRGDPDIRFFRFHRSHSWEVSGWNKIEIIVDANHARYFINGHLVNEALEMQSWNNSIKNWQPLTRGKILLQAEGAEISYKNIVLTPL